MVPAASEVAASAVMAAARVETARGASAGIMMSVVTRVALMA